MSFADEQFSRGSRVIDYDHLIELVKADPRAAFDYFTRFDCQIARELAAARECFSIFGASLPKVMSELDRLTRLSRAQGLQLSRMRSRLISRIDAETLKFIETGENGRNIPRTDERMTRSASRDKKKLAQSADPDERMRQRFMSKRDYRLSIGFGPGCDDEEDEADDI